MTVNVPAAKIRQDEFVSVDDGTLWFYDAEERDWVRIVMVDAAEARPNRPEVDETEGDSVCPVCDRCYCCGELVA